MNIPSTTKQIKNFVTGLKLLVNGFFFLKLRKVPLRKLESRAQVCFKGGVQDIFSTL